MRDYYEILGVDRGADDAALKSAFRKQAMEHHPDRNGGCEDSEARFKEINEAYSVLSDPQKRAAYDRFGHAGVNGAAGGGGGSSLSVRRLVSALKRVKRSLGDSSGSIPAKAAARSG